MVHGSPIVSGHNSPTMVTASSEHSVTQPPCSVPLVATRAPQPYAYTPVNKPRDPPSTGLIDGAVHPYAHLSAQARANLDDELFAAEEMFAPRFRQLEAISDPIDRKSKLDSLQNSFSTRQSIIRKKYGVRLRQRRTKAEIDAERHRIATWGGTTSTKRQRTDAGLGSTPTWRSTQQLTGSAPPVVSSRSSPAVVAAPVASPPGAETPTRNYLSVVDMNASGPGGSSATGAISDPPMPARQSEPFVIHRAPAARSLSSMQKSGYRISTHVSHRSASSEQSPEPHENPSGSISPSNMSDKTKTPPVKTQSRAGSAAQPVLLGDESSMSDDSDGEIPA